MGDQEQRHAAVGLLLEKQVRNLLAGLGVEIARRLVGDQHGGMRCKRTCNGDALLFAARQFAGIVRQPLCKTHRGKFVAGNGKGIGPPCKFQRHGNVFKGGHVRDQVKRLKDDADIAAAKIRDLVLAHRVDGIAVYVDFARIDPLKAGEHHQQCRLAGTRGPDDADRLATLHDQVHALEHVHRRCPVAQRQIGLL